MERQSYNVKLTETRQFIAEIYAESEEAAINICKNLYENDVLEFDSEDVISSNYEIIK